MRRDPFREGECTPRLFSEGLMFFSQKQHLLLCSERPLEYQEDSPAEVLHPYPQPVRQLLHQDAAPPVRRSLSF